MIILNIIKKQNDELYELLNKDNLPYLKPQDVANFMGIDVDCLRAAAESGRCPFALGGRNGLRGSRFTKIPKLAFFNWFTQGALYKGGQAQ